MPDDNTPIVYAVTIREVREQGDVKGLAALKAMVDVRPYDVILHDGEVKHFVNGRLRKHKELHGHHGHPASHGGGGAGVATVDELEEDRSASLVTLRSGPNGDEIVWIAPKPFSVVQIIPGEGEDPDGRRNPFPWSPPACSGPTLRIASGPPERHAKARRYKAVFAMDNQLIDPDFICTPP